MKVKKKSIQSLEQLLERKSQRLKIIIGHIEKAEQSIEKIRLYINELTKDIATNYNSAYIRQLDERERELKWNNIGVKAGKRFGKKKRNTCLSSDSAKNKVEGLKIKVDSFLNAAREDMLNKKKDFDEVYFSLMKRADEQCYSAYIGEDYMPHINLGAYRGKKCSCS